MSQPEDFPELDDPDLRELAEWLAAQEPTATVGEDVDCGGDGGSA